MFSIDSFKNKVIENAEVIKGSNGEIINSNNARVQNELDVSQQILDERARLAAQIKELNAQIALDEQSTQAELQNLQIQNTFAQQEAEIQRIQEFEALKLEAAFQAKEQEASLIEDAAQRKLAIERLGAEKELAFSKLSNKQILDEERQRIKTQEALQQGYLQSLSSGLQAASVLTKAGAKDQQKIAIAQAIVNTYQAGTRAFRDYPFPANLAVLASTIAGGLAQVQTIRSQSFAFGGVVGGFQGASAGNDNRTVDARDGEMFLNANQQKNLFDNINSGSPNGDIVIQIDGREVFRAVRNQIRQGAVLA
jgi:hypothetical protein